MQPDLDNQALYQISTVSTMTGVNAVTLRAWERRYGLLKPLRTDSGHRLYTEADIGLIKAILQLLNQGIAISRVRAALDQRPVPASAGEPTTAADPWQSSLNEMLGAIARFDEPALDAIYNEAMALYPVDVVTRMLLLPLLALLGQRWEARAGGVAEEHFFSVYLRNKLGGRFHHRNLLNTGPRLVAACLPGEQHEFGLLLFALAAHTRGYRLILLGANMPLEELPHVARRTDSAAIVLSGSMEIDTSALSDALHDLAGSADVPVFLGGACAIRHTDFIERCGIRPMGDDPVVGLRIISRFVSTDRP